MQAEAFLSHACRQGVVVVGVARVLPLHRRCALKILLVEDEPYWRERLVSALSSRAGFAVVASCATLAEALSAIRTIPFDLLVADIGLPDGSGIDAIRLARRENPSADILVATVFDDERNVVAAICAGATGYIVKESNSQMWMAAIEDLSQGCSPISPKIARFILQALQQPARSRRLMSRIQDASLAQPEAAAQPDESRNEEVALLTPREVEVLNLVAKGFTLPEVGQLLHISTTTARTHAKHIYQKLAVSTRGEAIFEATKLGILYR